MGKIFQLFSLFQERVRRGEFALVPNAKISSQNIAPKIRLNALSDQKSLLAFILMFCAQKI